MATIPKLQPYSYIKLTHKQMIAYQRAILHPIHIIKKPLTPHPMNTLISKAKELKPKPHKSKMSDNEIGVAVAWMKGELRRFQVEEVLDFTKNHQTYVFLARALREAYNRKIIK